MPMASVTESEVAIMQWKEEALEKLKRYSAMQTAAKNIPEQICMLEANVATLRSPSAPKIGGRGGVRSREDAIINNLAERQELEWSLARVKQWLAVTNRGLNALSNEELVILQRMYLFPERKAVDRLCGELGVEQATVYRKRDKALQHFTAAMYGFPET